MPPTLGYPNAHRNCSPHVVEATAFNYPVANAWNESASAVPTIRVELDRHRIRFDVAASGIGANSTAAEDMNESELVCSEFF